MCVIGRIVETEAYVGTCDKASHARSRRIGVEYVEIYKEKLWRFYINRNKYVSR